MNHPDRIAKATALLDSLEVDAFLVTNLSNVRYLTGFSGSNGQVLLTRDSAFFYSDGRYKERAKDLVRGAEIGIYPTRLADLLAPKVEESGIKRLAIEGQTVTLVERDDLAQRLDGVAFVSTKGVVENLRRVKDVEEVAKIKQAIAVADEAFEHVLGALAPGRTEKEIALELEIRMRRSGAEDVSFEPIVGSGPLSAHIHHSPSDREFQKGDLILMDFGALVDGYHSDMTRTVVLGPATDEQREMYDLVLRAQAAGIAALGPGAHGREVDAAARKVIDDAGRAEEFAHGLGHGVGLDIHEAPNLGKTSEDTLAPGEVITVEPGVYVPGAGGVRIEDCVLVTGDGSEVLGSTHRDTLLEL